MIFHTLGAVAVIIGLLGSLLPLAVGVAAVMTLNGKADGIILLMIILPLLFIAVVIFLIFKGYQKKLRVYFLSEIFFVIFCYAVLAYLLIG